MAQSNPNRPMNQNFNVGVSHSRSLSQPTIFGSNCLPPLSPFPPSESSLASSNSNLKDMSLEEIDVSSQGSPIPPSFTRENLFRANDSLPPHREHRRSNSDVPLGFSAMIQSSPQLVPIGGTGNLGSPANMRDTCGFNSPMVMKRQEMNGGNYGKSSIEGKLEGEVVNDVFDKLMNMDAVGGSNSSFTDNRGKDNIINGAQICGGDVSNSESENIARNGQHFREGVKRGAAGDIAPPARHHRSLSMDSAFGNFHFADESPKLQASLCNRVNHHSPSNSMSDNSAKLNLDFGHGEFNELELKKIMGDERLSEIAISDPKRAKRILANRQSAARSKERKLRYISELEHKVQTLQTETTTLSAQFTALQKDYTELTNENNELKFRFQAMEQQAKLRDALHEALTGEVQRLKFANMELREEGRTSNGMTQQIPMKLHMFPVQRQQQENIS